MTLTLSLCQQVLDDSSGGGGGSSGSGYNGSSSDHVAGDTAISGEAAPNFQTPSSPIETNGEEEEKETMEEVKHPVNIARDLGRCGQIRRFPPLRGRIPFWVHLAPAAGGIQPLITLNGTEAEAEEGGGEALRLCLSLSGE